MLILRIPWFTPRRPYVGLYCRQWGMKYAQYTRQPILVYRWGFGVGRMTEADYAANKKNRTWHPAGHWKFWHFERQKPQ